MKLLPIHQTIEENELFVNHPDCQETLALTMEYYEVIGFNRPWIAYYAEHDGILVGSGAYKGQPVSGRVEIAYSTFDKFRQQGMGTEIARKLVELALASAPSVNIIARTLPEEGSSTKILKKNGFQCTGIVSDPDDGDVWEWCYKSETSTEAGEQDLPNA